MVTSAQSRLGDAPEEAVKSPVKIDTNENITLSGEQTLATLDSNNNAINVAVVAGDRVLVRAQTNASENGIYVVSADAWKRATDWNDNRDVINGMLIMSSENSKFWQAVIPDPFVIGTDDVSFTDTLQDALNAGSDAQDSADAAAASESNASASASAASTSETNAENSANAASASETNAGNSETNASNSANAASTSESNAATSESNAATSEANASTSESNAAASEAALSNRSLSYREGLQYEINSVDSDHDIFISAGSVMNHDASVFMRASSNFIKQIDANWAVGSGNGGFPSGLTLTANTDYRIFMISKADGTVDFGFDTSTSAVNLLSDATGYVNYRRIGWFRTDGSNNIRSFVKVGRDEYRWSTYIEDLETTSPSTTGSNQALTVFPDTIAKVSVQGFLTTTSTDSASLGIILSQTDQDNANTDGPYGILSSNTAGLRQVTEIVDLKVNTSKQIRYRTNGTVATGETRTVRITTLGWTDIPEES